MRCVHTAVLTLLAASAVPSVAFAQIVIPYRNFHSADRLDHALPVATVTRTGDPIALVSPQAGDGFVLGAATLDLKDPDHPMIVFAISNGREMPIPLSRVGVNVRAVNAPADDGALLFVCGYSGYLTNIMMAHRAVSVDTTLQPGATLTVAMPVGPHCHPYADGRQQGPLVGFLVHLEYSDGPVNWGARHAEINALSRSAFEKLRSHSLQ